MKSFYILIVLVSLALGVIIPNLGVEPHANNLYRRVRGNIPGDSGYEPRDDYEHISKGGRFDSNQLRAQHKTALAVARGPKLTSPSKSPYGYKSSRNDKGVRHSYGINGDKYDTFVEAGISAIPPPQGITPLLHGDVRNIPYVGKLIAPRTQASATTPFKAGFMVGAGPIYAGGFHSFGARPELVRAVNPRPGKWYQTANKERVFIDENDDVRSAHKKQRLWGLTLKDVYNLPEKRSDVLNDLREDEINGSTTSLSIPTTLTRVLWQTSYDQFQSLQANASKLLAPILDKLINKSNTTAAYEMAWSIETQLLGYPTILTGPYLNGLTNFDSFENTWLLQRGFLLDLEGNIYRPTNQTLSNTTLTDAYQMLSVNEYFKSTYDDTWNAAVNAVNLTSPGSTFTVLENLVCLAKLITSTNNTDIVPQSFGTVNETASKAHSARWTQLIALNNA